MLRALWTAASGMAAQQTNIDTITNNLANVNTHGYKRSRADFQDLRCYNRSRQPDTDWHSNWDGDKGCGHPKAIFSGGL
jgi:flagellar basal-body rod protein FlgG